jgi:hypothetical protein
MVHPPMDFPMISVSRFRPLARKRGRPLALDIVLKKDRVAGMMMVIETVMKIRVLRLILLYILTSSWV